MIIIALEGGCCSGKSTIGKKAEEEKWFYFPEAMSFLSIEEKRLLWTSVGTDLAIDILLEAEKRRLIEIKKLPENSIVILDRSYHTFLAFEYTSKNIERFNKYRELFSKLENVAKIDFLIFIDINYDERTRRLKERGDIKTENKSIMFQAEFNQRLKTFFQIYYVGQKQILDLSLSDKESSFKEVKNIIDTYKKYFSEEKIGKTFIFEK